MHRLLQRMLGTSCDPQNTNFCAVCRKLFTGRRIHKELGVTATAILRQDFRQLEESARGSCQLCRLRWSQLTPQQRDELKECRKVTYGFWESRIGDGVVFEYWLDHKFGASKPWFSGSVAPGSHSDCQQWIHRSSNFLPTRLVDAGLDGSYIPRVCEGASLLWAHRMLRYPTAGEVRFR
jgi:hypothetical protein